MDDVITVQDVEIKSGGDEVVEYIKNNHYSGTCNPISNKWKLLYNGNIVGGIVFANPMSEKVREFVTENKKEVTELHRLYTDERCGKNVESWFISHSLNKLKNKKSKYRFVISYADTAENHVGTVYQACNAVYTGNTDDEGSSHGYYVDENGNRRSERQGGENITKSQAKERGWEIKNATGKHRYVFPLPDEYESRQDCIEDLKPERKPYP
jgi:hypothetical protein